MRGQYRLRILRSLERYLERGSRIVVCETFGDDIGREIERGRDGGRAGDIRDDWLADEEAGNSEWRGTDGEIDFGSFFVEVSVVDMDGRRESCAVGEGLFFAGEFHEVRVESVVFV